MKTDIRRCELACKVVGPSIALAVDANQRWDVGAAIAWLKELARFDLAWVEEPTSPDDVSRSRDNPPRDLPLPISTGEHTQKSRGVQTAVPAHAVDLIQIDAARVGGVNEYLAILLMAAKFGIRVFPHAGGVWLCELVQHLAMADFIAIGGSMEDRAIEDRRSLRT